MRPSRPACPGRPGILPLIKGIIVGAGGTVLVTTTDVEAARRDCLIGNPGRAKADSVTSAPTHTRASSTDPMMGCPHLHPSFYPLKFPPPFFSDPSVERKADACPMGAVLESRRSGGTPSFRQKPRTPRRLLRAEYPLEHAS